MQSESMMLKMEILNNTDTLSLRMASLVLKNLGL